MLFSFFDPEIVELFSCPTVSPSGIIRAFRVCQCVSASYVHDASPFRDLFPIETVFQIVVDKVEK